MYTSFLQKNTEAKLLAAQKKAKAQSKIRSNLAGPLTDLMEYCKSCHISQDEDNKNPKRRKIVWLFCKQCENWTHEKCVPKELKRCSPTLLKKVNLGQVFDFQCC